MLEICQWVDYCSPGHRSVQAKSRFTMSHLLTMHQGLTGYNESVVYGQACRIQDDGRVWHELYTTFVDYDRGNYALLTQTVTPVIAVWMPIANANRPSSIQYATAGMICGVANDYNPGSLKIPALPSPTPVGGGGLSGGAIAGIVVGVVVGVGLIAGLAAWWFLAKRRKAKRTANTSTGGEFDEKDTKDLTSSGSAVGSHDVKNSQSSPVEAPTSRPIAELPQNDFRPELDAGKDNQVFEADAKMNAAPVELEGSTAHVRR